jgi:ubiquinone/menaquinone biosynthesis C-methylase UbiE/N-acetylglutamate synthase-like GNAT family acetyltransferase
MNTQSIELESIKPLSGDPLSNDPLSNGPDAVRELVRSHYAERVRSQSSCCGTGAATSCCSVDNIELDENWGTALYSQDELAQVPEDAANVSYGCGNPTALASLRPGEIVLDLGSGGGIDCFLAARKVGAQGYVYGVDMTDEMLDLARRNAVKSNAANVEFRKGAIEALPLPDESVDVIISNCVVNLSPDKEQVLREAFRVLRPGGRLAISDVVIDGDLSDLPVSERQVRAALSWAGCIAGALTQAQFLAYMQATGFEDAEVEIERHYTLEALGQDAGSATQLLPLSVAEELAQRFTSSMIYARKPAPLTLALATPTDLPELAALLQRCELPLAGLAEDVDVAIVARSGRHLVGSVALELYGETALLRSLAVYPSLRGNGLGHRLVEAILREAQQRGVRHLYLLTTSAGEFFPRFGFQPIERQQVAQAVQQSVEFTSACPSSALAMHLALAM